MAKKIAISMPEPIFMQMERSRKKDRKDRSRWIQEAILEQLRRREHADDAAAYIRSYREMPETEEERAFAQAALRAFPWKDFEWKGPSPRAVKSGGLSSRRRTRRGR